MNSIRPFWTPERLAAIERVERGKRVSLFQPQDFAAVEVLLDYVLGRVEEREDIIFWRFYWHAWDGASRAVTGMVVQHNQEGHPLSPSPRGLFFKAYRASPRGNQVISRSIALQDRDLQWEGGGDSDLGNLPLDLNLRILARLASRAA